MFIPKISESILRGVHRFSDRAATGRRRPRGDDAATTRRRRARLGSRPTDRALRKQCFESELSPEYPVNGRATFWPHFRRFLES